MSKDGVYELYNFKTNSINRMESFEFILLQDGSMYIPQALEFQEKYTYYRDEKQLPPQSAMLATMGLGGGLITAVWLTPYNGFYARIYDLVIGTEPVPNSTLHITTSHRAENPTEEPIDIINKQFLFVSNFQ